MLEGRHEIEIAGAKILIENGEAIVVSAPTVKCCPLRKKIYGVEHESAETVLKTLYFSVEDYGMFTSSRKLRSEEKTVSFGAAEIISDALKDGLLDAAVLVCEGAGTVICVDPCVVQAIGAHMTGLLRTSPIPAIQNALRREGSVLLSDDAVIDQMGGLMRAAEMGYKRIAVTVAGPDAPTAQAIKTKERELGIQIVVVSVHNSAVCGFMAELLVYFSDLLYLCASRQLQEIAGKRALLQMGTSIPVLAMSEEGKKLILNRAMNVNDTMLIMKSTLPRCDLSPGPEPLFTPQCGPDTTLVKK